MRRNRNLVTAAACGLLSWLFASCIPASISRIGPARPSKPKTCDIQILPPGETPDRPWVDIGAVLLQNCQEYSAGMCRKWLVQKACELGGEVAYLSNPEPPRDAVNNINFRVLVAVYAVELTTPFPSGPGCKEPTPPRKRTEEAGSADTDTDTDTDAASAATSAETPSAEPTERCLEQ